MTILQTHHTIRSTPAGPRAASLSPWLAGLWSVAYLGLAVLHLVRDTGAPWVPTEASVLGSLSSSDVSVLIVALGALGLVGLALRSRSPRVAGSLLVATGLVTALVLADARSLTFLGYLPMLLLGLVGVGPVDEVATDVLVPALASVGESVGGLALVLTGVAALRGTTDRPGWPVATAARVCRWAVAVAVAVPAFYALTRIAWALGIPFGVRDEFLVELGDGKFAGLGLGLAALVGCVLTAGLVMRWGEVFWSWLPVIGGRPVPVRLALLPSVFVGAVVFSAGLAFWRLMWTGQITDIPGNEADWAAWVPELFWPLWGVALAVAGLAYAARRVGER
ncbi:hypothetical protein [Nocardioides allogilvus]|uniref:hypothetical protein n=1 Tax=Nocardioides allogilvus TaxID=2072017 RepID=UPI000D2FBF6F|nr:hypothetical protein [Nocardioides allogilvus]